MKHSQTHTHHHHLSAIALLPIAALLIIPGWSKASMAPTLTEYEERAMREEQQMQLLQTQFVGVQRARTLLRDGDMREEYPSVVWQHLHEDLSSPIERYSRARIRNEILEQRIAAMKSTMNDIGEQLIHIDLSDQELALIDDGEIIRTYPVSSGAPGTPTPRGEFQIHRKQTLRISQQEVPYRMPHYMAFTKSQSHGLHALPYLGDGPESSDFWHEALDHIGIPVSHGCVRLLPEDAITVFEWVNVGTPVLINT